MPSLRDIKRHISAVKNIKQITYAMKMVASARIKRSQNQILSLRPYVISLEDIISQLRCELNEDDFRFSKAYRFFKVNESKHVGIIVITGDKGLCGAFNNQIIHSAMKIIKENSGKEIHLITVGKKGTDFFRKVKNVNVDYQMVNIFPKVSYSHALILSSELIRLYDNYNLEKVWIVYGEFKNMLVQEIKRKILLPISDLIKERDKIGVDYFIFEPEKVVILESLISKYITTEIYRFLLENQASELAARMNAMELANKNAGEILDELTVKMNKQRQAQITNELTEIVGGASAVGG